MNPKTLRTKHNLTQSDLAKLLGVTSRTIRNWERTGFPKLAKLALETVDRNLSDTRL